jgi:hypothetical protein
MLGVKTPANVPRRDGFEFDGEAVVLVVMRAPWPKCTVARCLAEWSQGDGQAYLPKRSPTRQCTKRDA